MNSLKRFVIFCIPVLLIAFSIESGAQPIAFAGNLDLIDEDLGGGVYSGVPPGTLFTGTIDPLTGGGEISDGTTTTTFTCCIAAGGLSIGNDSTLDAETAALLNLLAGTSSFFAGQILDSVDIEGDVATAGNGRIEVGLSYILSSDSFDDNSPGNYPFDPTKVLLSVFFITEEDEDGEDIYSGIGQLRDPQPNPQPNPPLNPPPARITLNSDGSPTTAMVSGGISKDAGDSYVAEFQVGDTIQILVRLEPEGSDIGINSEIFVIAVAGSNSLLVTPGGLVTWDGQLESLVPFDEIVLAAENEFNILQPFGGEFTLTSAEAGSYAFFIGYTVGGGVITYNDEALELIVTE